jgi:hypothetical protein
MGRPRKFPRQIAEEPVIAPDEAMALEGMALDPSGFSLGLMDLMAWDEGLLTAAEHFPAANFPNSADLAARHPVSNSWNAFNALAPQINFGAVPSAAQRPPSLPPSQEISLEEVARLIAADFGSDHTPGLTPNSMTTSDESNAHTEDSSQPAACACLPNLYLTLETLRECPKDVVKAMHVARSASRTVNDAIFCSSCGNSPIEDLQHRLPMHSFQTMMMIGAVLPSIVSQYSHILELVDKAAAQADKDHKRIHFDIREYGGLWGALADPEQDCGLTDLLRGTDMPPAQWRLTIRALLRVDVYGIKEDRPGKKFNQTGLKDVIQMMEDRSTERHRQIDERIADGRLVLDHRHAGMQHAHGDRPQCLKVLDIAKKSLESLVIA